MEKLLYNYQGLTDRILSEEEFMEAKKSGKEEERVEFLDKLLESAWKNEDSNIIIPYLINNSRSRFQGNNEEYKKIVSEIARKNGKTLPPNIDWSFGTSTGKDSSTEKV